MSIIAELIGQVVNSGCACTTCEDSRPPAALSASDVSSVAKAVDCFGDETSVKHAALHRFKQATAFSIVSPKGIGKRFVVTTFDCR